MFDGTLGALLLKKEEPALGIRGYVCHFEALHTCVLSERLVYQLAYHYMGSHNVITLRIGTLAQCTNHNAAEEIVKAKPPAVAEVAPASGRWGPCPVARIRPSYLGLPASLVPFAGW